MGDEHKWSTTGEEIAELCVLSNNCMTERYISVRANGAHTFFGGNLVDMSKLRNPAHWKMPGARKIMNHVLITPIIDTNRQIWTRSQHDFRNLAYLDLTEAENKFRRHFTPQEPRLETKLWGMKLAEECRAIFFDDSTDEFERTYIHDGHLHFSATAIVANGVSWRGINVSSDEEWSPESRYSYVIHVEWS